MSNAHDVVLVRAADAEVLADAPGSLITLLADSARTGGKVTSNRATFEKGAIGAPRTSTPGPPSSSSAWRGSWTS